MKENSKTAKSESSKKRTVKNNSSQAAFQTPSDLRAVAKRLWQTEQFQTEDLMVSGAVGFFIHLRKPKEPALAQWAD